MENKIKSLLWLLPAFLMALPTLQAQYFGRNKPRYQKLDFKVTETEHFTLYDYLNNPEKERELATAAETWYQLHQKVLGDSIRFKNPLIIYNDHAGFQQTNAIQGDISVGTGGVTEGLRNRVVFPVAMTNQQTNHVLGHELVHAFQYNMILAGDSTNMQNLANLPLWMIEGLAEYLSIGRVDAHTALWMRDAVLHNDLPKLRDLNNPRYFPYRWGQAFWAYVTGVYGDEAIRPLFMNTARLGFENAVRFTLDTNSDSLFTVWHRTLRNHYGQWVTLGKKDDKKDLYERYAGMVGSDQRIPGKKLLSDDNAGAMNVCPVLSPNGKYVVYLSEKNLITTDLYLADAKTGKVLRKVASSAQDGHIDQFNAIESAGTWAPDNKRFAFDVYYKGKNMLVVKDVFKGKTLQRIQIPGVPAFSNPTWSPDGKTIVVSGLVNGQTDLYAYDLKTKKVRRLTNDKYSEILPTWSSDGQSLAYSTDYYSLQRGRVNGAWHMNLAVMDMASGSVENLDIFPGADNLNPQFDKVGNLLFLSNRDGFRNLYRYDLRDQKVYQLTKLATGITGITPYSPALSVAEDRDRLLFTYYAHGNYIIYEARPEDFSAEEVSSTAVDMVPAALPPFKPGQRDLVNMGLRLMDANVAATDQAFSSETVPYKAKFTLEYMGGSAGVGAFTGNSGFGNVVGVGGGGIDMLFGDILGNNQLYLSGALPTGRLQDLSGQVSYINQKNRLNWGVTGSHIAFQTGGFYYQDPFPYVEQDANGQDRVYYRDVEVIDRLFQQRLGLFTFFPLSVAKRFELGVALEAYRQRSDTTIYKFTEFGRQYDQDRFHEKLGSISLPNLNAAYVGDNSYFGLTAPLQGWRYRIGVEQYVGKYNFTALLLDGRRYFRAKPFTLAVRGMSYNRMGIDQKDSENIFSLFVAQPFFVRGYTQNVLYSDTTGNLLRNVGGNSIAVGNFEVRLPFTGPRKLSLIPLNIIPTDLNLFFDAGLAYGNLKDFKAENRKPIFSAGVSIRLNLFGVLVLEPYFAMPFNAPAEQRRMTFGMNFVPGW